jgi:hypothetical protein
MVQDLEEIHRKVIINDICFNNFHKFNKKVTSKVPQLAIAISLMVKETAIPTNATTV